LFLALDERSGLSAIATRTWCVHTTLTRSPAANDPVPGENEVRRQVSLWCRNRPTVIQFEPSFQIVPVAAAVPCFFATRAFAEARPSVASPTRARGMRRRRRIPWEVGAPPRWGNPRRGILVARRGEFPRMSPSYEGTTARRPRSTLGAERA